jgi:hypothetical protein
MAVGKCDGEHATCSPLAPVRLEVIADDCPHRAFDLADGIALALILISHGKVRRSRQKPTYLYLIFKYAIVRQLVRNPQLKTIFRQRRHCFRVLAGAEQFDVKKNVDV